MCTSDYNQIEFSTSRPASSRLFLHGLPRLFALILRDTGRFCPPVMVFFFFCCIFGHFWFHMDGFWSNNCFHVDTNHLQVISLDGTLNLLISLEAWVYKGSLFQRFRFYNIFSSLMFVSPPSRWFPTAGGRRESATGGQSVDKARSADSIN